MKSEKDKSWEQIFETLWEEEGDIPLSFQNLKKWEDIYYPIQPSSLNEVACIEREKVIFQEARNRLVRTKSIPRVKSNLKFLFQTKYMGIAAIFLLGFLLFFTQNYFLKQELYANFQSPYYISGFSPGVKIFLDSKPVDPTSLEEQVLDYNSRIFFRLSKNSYLELKSKSYTNDRIDGSRKIQLIGAGIYSLQWSDLQKETWEMSYGSMLLSDEVESANKEKFENSFQNKNNEPNPTKILTQFWELKTDNARYTKKGTVAYFKTDSTGDKVTVLDGAILVRMTDADSKEISLSKDQEFRLPRNLESENKIGNTGIPVFPWKMVRLSERDRKVLEKKFDAFQLDSIDGKSSRLSSEDLKKKYKQLQMVEFRNGEKKEGYVFMRSGKWMIHSIEGIQEIDWGKIKGIENF
ncbi:hypothetical protein [Leptospira sp. GIMC2001]|uniref:hypothetical protein n=1 Tax=Leptospira sp. GIMC2001 TaxID=1513297 RepID=UPI00234B72FA|nr:hypothetical protein [Leptospira sp. GIMC2001]WCL47749.1 hypothetical protein O4O04_00395 [Leptospira sp. GIMC2001]